MFTELLPLLKDRTLMLIIADTGGETLRVNVIPQRRSGKENDTAENAFASPLTITGNRVRACHRSQDDRGREKERAEQQKEDGQHHSQSGSAKRFRSSIRSGEREAGVWQQSAVRGLSNNAVVVRFRASAGSRNSRRSRSRRTGPNRRLRRLLLRPNQPSVRKLTQQLLTSRRIALRQESVEFAMGRFCPISNVIR